MFKKILASFISTIFIIAASAEVISITDKNEIRDWGGSCAGHLAYYVGEEGGSIWSIDGDDGLAGIFLKTSQLTGVKFSADKLKVNTSNSFLSVQVQLTAKRLKKGNGWSEDITQSVSSELVTCEFHGAVRGEGKNKIPSKIVHYYKHGDGGHAYTRYESESDCIENTKSEMPSLYCHNRFFPRIDSESFKKDGFPVQYGFGEGGVPIKVLNF